jgi:penicillin-binding protein 2
MFQQKWRKSKISRGVEIEDSIMTVTEQEKAIIETPFEKKGLKIIWFITIIILSVILGRVFYLDVVKGKYYSQLSKNNRIRLIVIKAPRGNILDKSGKFLARNVPSIDAVLVPYDLPNDLNERRKIAENLSNILNMDEGNAEAIIESQNKKSLDPVLFKENITQDQALIILEKIDNLPGVYLDKTAIRNYENSSMFSHIIGYDGKITPEEMSDNKSYQMTDYIGKTGIEKTYENELKGENGADQVEIDSVGRIVKNLGVINPKPGSDLVLNIDEGLQKKIYDSLSGILEKTGSKTAAAVAINPQTGGILALVSLPSYDNNLFAKGISNDEYKGIISDKDLPLLNRVIGGEYPPGSTLKPAVAAAALTEGTITPETTVSDSSGMISIGAWHFGDWKTHGIVDVRKAIAESCDVFFYSVGGGYGNISGLGMDRMKKYENLFGFGEPTGIDLSGESSGLIPSEDWKLQKIKEKWYIGDSYHAAIGQGFVTATPLQLANYTAAIANKGTLYSPRIVNRIKNVNGQEKIVEPKIVRSNFIPKNVLDIVREGMRQTVLSGTAQNLKDLPVEAAGKTGTAQFGTEDKTHSWFITFAPFDNPSIAIAVLVEGGGEGNSAALPVAKDALSWYFSQDKK